MSAIPLLLCWAHQLLPLGCHLIHSNSTHGNNSTTTLNLTAQPHNWLSFKASGWTYRKHFLCWGVQRGITCSTDTSLVCLVLDCMAMPLPQYSYCYMMSSLLRDTPVMLLPSKGQLLLSYMSQYYTIATEQSMLHINFTDDIYNICHSYTFIIIRLQSAAFWDVMPCSLYTVLQLRTLFTVTAMRTSNPTS
jgi:hypothetical protein